MTPMNETHQTLSTDPSAVFIAGVRVDNVSFAEALSRVSRMVELREPCYLVNPNVDILVRCSGDPWFVDYYRNGALSLVDGVPVLWAAKFLGAPLKEKISGSDFVPAVCRLSHEKGYRLFFMGGRPGAADLAKAVMEKKFPNVKIVGTYCPPFGFERDENENRKILHVICEARPDILFVGLGAPKQERWIERYHRELNIPVCMGVGVTFEYISGMVKRAPKWMQKVGLEWFFRLMVEPGRLWRRYLVDDMRFFSLVFRQKFGSGRR